MFSLWQLGLLALLYVMVLFVIAWWGDRAERRGLRRRGWLGDRLLWRHRHDGRNNSRRNWLGHKRSSWIWRRNSHRRQNRHRRRKTRLRLRLF